ncbi:hypothetical protein BS78_08G040700 [Paspalum vaginatum]|nr:hypothetical protein BS78_08G040700 [Paspalum vaginatum]
MHFLLPNPWPIQTPPKRNEAATGTPPPPFVPSRPPSRPPAVVPGFIRRTAPPSTPLPHRLLLHQWWFQGLTDLRPDGGAAVFHFPICWCSRRIKCKYEPWRRLENRQHVYSSSEGELIFAYRDGSLYISSIQITRYQKLKADRNGLQFTKMIACQK